MGTSNAFEMIVMPVLSGVGGVIAFFVALGFIRFVAGLAILAHRRHLRSLAAASGPYKPALRSTGRAGSRAAGFGR